MSFLAEKKLENPCTLKITFEPLATPVNSCFLRREQIWLAQSIAILGLPSDKLILSGCLTASYDGWRRIKDATARA